jgi:hypothetical protein
MIFLSRLPRRSLCGMDFSSVTGFGFLALCNQPCSLSTPRLVCVCEHYPISLDDVRGVYFTSPMVFVDTGLRFYVCAPDDWFRLCQFFNAAAEV